MTDHTMEEKRNHAVLVGLHASSLSQEENASDATLEELEALLETAGGVCVGSVLQNRETPEARTFIGEGKVAEVAALVQAQGADLVVFDNELSPSQQRVLTEEVGAQVIDRAGLILDIFAQRARTKEGRLQVELAQHKYLLPRLTGMGGTWSVRLPPGENPHWNPRPWRNPAGNRPPAISAGRSPSSPRTWRRSVDSGGPAGPPGRRMISPWWPLWAIPTPASPPSSMP